MVGNWLGMELPFIKNHKESYDEDTVLQPFSQELGHHDYCHAHVELLCFEEYLGIAARVSQFMPFCSCMIRMGGMM